jgi:hypothetical protein
LQKNHTLGVRIGRKWAILRVKVIFRRIVIVTFGRFCIFAWLYININLGRWWDLQYCFCRLRYYFRVEGARVARRWRQTRLRDPQS